jgi:oxygen-independent coproporphyrinogen-3 oxidase
MKPAPRAPVERGEVFAPEPIAVYVHLPFCRSFCAYCAFNKVRDDKAQERYLEALLAEIDWYAARPALAGVQISSVYFGGGTPSCLPADWITRILERLRQGFGLRADAQITLEGNPDSLEAPKLAQYRAAGVGRISVGVQSFDEVALRRLGRAHRAADIQRCLEQVREAGFDEVSADLMFGLPGQRLADFRVDLARALEAPVTHLSLFPMIYHRNTPLWDQREARRPLRRMYDWGADALAGCGFAQYTPEDFTRSGVRCRYQLDVWQPPVKRFLGFGAGALSTFGDHHWANLGQLEAYLDAARQDPPPLATLARRSRAHQLRDFFLYSAKTLRFDAEVFRAEFGVHPRAVVGPLPEAAVAAGLITRVDRAGWELTRRGRFYACLLWGELILDRLAVAGRSCVPLAGARVTPL